MGICLKSLGLLIDGLMTELFCINDGGNNVMARLICGDVWLMQLDGDCLFFIKKK